MLLSTEKMKEVFIQNHQSIGTLKKENSSIKEQRDCKYLRRLGKNDYHLFNSELTFKKRKLQQETKHSHDSKFIRSWMKQYQQDFETLEKGEEIENPFNENVLSLCPVTWKSIESIFKYKILKKLVTQFSQPSPLRPLAPHHRVWMVPPSFSLAESVGIDHHCLYRYKANITPCIVAIEPAFDVWLCQSDHSSNWFLRAVFHRHHAGQ